MNEGHTEIPSVGDVLSLEAKTMALVGTIVEITEDTIVLEGGVYEFDESDLAETQDQSGLSRLKELSGIEEAESEQYAALVDILIRTGYKKSYVTGTSSYWIKTGLNFRIELGLLPTAMHITVYPMGSTTPVIMTSLLMGSKMHHMLRGTSQQSYSTDKAISVLDKLEHSYIDTGMNVDEAKYQGREVKLGKPMSGDVRKYKVYVKDPKTGNVKKVNFGDPNMEIKRDDPKRRANFRARHGCGTPRASDRTKAAYWSCRMWSTKPVGKILKGR